MELKSLLSVFIHVNALVVHGFLLDGGNAKGGNITGSNNFLTVQSFLEFQNQQHLKFEQQHYALEQQHRDSEQLRHYVDQTIAILTSQLNEKLREFGSNTCDNDSAVSYNNLLKDNAELKDNVTSLQKELERTKVENMALKSELLNKTSNFESRLLIIEESDKIRTQFDMTNITRQVKTLEEKTKNLEQMQVARGQDLVALFKGLNDFKNVTSKQITESNGKLTLLNSSLSTQGAEMEAVHHKLNGSLAQLSDKVNIMDQKVAFTACASTSQNEHSGYIVKFGNIRTNVGVTDPSSFISSGKFLCEHDGIYLVYVTLDTVNTDIYYYIYVNNSPYVYVYEYDNKVLHQRGDVSVTLNLHRGDTVWVQLGGTMYVSGGTSCLTIAKIK